MMKVLNSIFSTKPYSGAEVERARFTYGISVLLIVAALLTVYILPGSLAGFNVLGNVLSSNSQNIIIAAWGVILINATMIVALRFGGLKLASWLVTLSIFGAHVFLSSQGYVESFSFVLPALIIVMGALLVGQAGVIVFSGLCIVHYVVLSLFIPVEAAPFSIVTLMIFLVTGVITDAFLRFAQASRVEGESLEAAERFKLADINMRVTRQASERENLDVAMNSTLELILENYPRLYHAQVFLIDEDGIQARLVASTGEIGERLLEKGHSLAVGSLSVIGQTTFKGDLVVARAGEQDTVHRQNVLLSETTLEAAFPLRVAGEIIGALDLQSRHLLDLSETDALTFQSLANSLALVIDSIRQFEAAKSRITENQRLAEQTRSALRDVERLNQRLIGRAWSEYISGKGSDFGLLVDFEADSIEKNSVWTQTLASAVELNNLVKDANIIAIPLQVRGHVIGAMEFELPENQEFSPEDLELIQEVSERFGLAAENTRLVEESQRTAQRETLVNEITSRFQSAQNVEATLAEAARSLSDTLSADRVMIRLGAPRDNSNGGS